MGASHKTIMKGETDMTIKAVPTTYAGTRFQSTLEADWAATLDNLNIQWQYEPEAVQLPNGLRYRPDFYLPELTTWLEVKGPHNDRLDKAEELRAATEHQPDCETAMTGHTLNISVLTDAAEREMAAILCNATDGNSPVIVKSARHEWDGVNPSTSKWTSDQTFKVKRRIAITHNLIATLGNLRSVHVSWDDGCTHNWSNPWRLVVIGRPSTRGHITFESTDGDQGQLFIIRCPSCDRHSFFDHYGLWRCRRCNDGGKVYHGGAWNSGGAAADFDGHLPFIRASRYGHTMPAVPR